jgi:hypothetical protein
LPSLGVDADGDLAGEPPAGLDDEIGIAHGDGAEDDAGEPLFQPGLDMRERADAAAELHRAHRRFQDRLDRGAIDGLALEGAVQVDHMQPFEALVLEGFRLGGGIGVVDGRLVHLALDEAHALAVFQVDGGKQDHFGVQGAHCRKLERIRARRASGSFPGGTACRTCCAAPDCAVTGPP